MLLITTRCHDPNCEGTVTFPREDTGDHEAKHRLGTCDTCGEMYSLYAGQIKQLSDVLPDEVGPTSSGPEGTGPSN